MKSGISYTQALVGSATPNPHITNPNHPVTRLELVKLVTGLMLNGGLRQTPLPAFNNNDVARALGLACDILSNHVGLEIEHAPLVARTQIWYDTRFGDDKVANSHTGGTHYVGDARSGNHLITTKGGEI